VLKFLFLRNAVIELFTDVPLPMTKHAELLCPTVVFSFRITCRREGLLIDFTYDLDRNFRHKTKA
jgi:hypothetical protein